MTFRVHTDLFTIRRIGLEGVVPVLIHAEDAARMDEVIGTWVC